LAKDFEKEHPVVKGLKRMSQLESDYSDIKTQLVRGRLKETKWEDLRYMDALMSLERHVELSIRRQSPGFGGALAYFHLRKRYPVEHECIDREMTQGIRTSFDEFMNMETEHDRAEAQLEIESVERGMRKREESIRKEQELRQQWHELGGKS
jgi:hypothetical protein